MSRRHPGPRVVIAAGGTGGHLFPALALALALRERGADPLTAGSAGPEIRAAFAEAGLPFQAVPTVRRPEKARDWPFFPGAAGRALAASLALATRPRPAALVGMGGYASAAPATAALALGVPLYFCEQNLLPGRVTRCFSSRARAVFTSFPESAAWLKGRNILPWGNPLRPFPADGDRADHRRRLGLAAERFTVFVLGGSQGARALNRLVAAALGHLDPAAVQFIHLAGPVDHPAAAAACRRGGFLCHAAPFSRDMATLYRAADLALCRAGATTIAELAVFGLPAILVPFPFAAEDHQKKNAAALATQGAALLAEQRDLDGPTLARLIDSLRTDPVRRAAMGRAAAARGRPEAAARIAAYLLASSSRSTVTRNT